VIFSVEVGVKEGVQDEHMTKVTHVADVVEDNMVLKDQMGKNKNSYADILQPKDEPKVNSLNFRYLVNEDMKLGFDVVLPKESVRVVCNKLEFTLYGYFLGDRIAYPVVEYFVRSNWNKFGLQKSMIKANGFFFFKLRTKRE